MGTHRSSTGTGGTRGALSGERRTHLGRDLRAAAGYLLVILLTLLAVSPLFGQAAADPPPLRIYADTAGVDRMDPSEPVYLTWIYARASDEAPPVSGVLVAFDCANHRVRRLAQVKFGVMENGAFGGHIEEVDGDWQEPVIPRLFTLICEVGAAHDRDNVRGYGTPPSATDSIPHQPS